jgi:fatty-acyl-CoA synthase
VRIEPIFSLIEAEEVTHLCGAPVVLSTLASAPAQVEPLRGRRVKVLTGGAPPPAALLERMEHLGFDVTQGYGLTESYGPAAICTVHDDWHELTSTERARLKARQGIATPLIGGLIVADPITLEPVPKDGVTIGEVVLRGNTIMKGYLKNPAATEESFRGGWFHSGDLAVWHADGYIEIRDRSKDIIISGGEKISSLEVESVLCRHPAVLEAAVVARPDPKWGESPCAFVTLKTGQDLEEREVITFCRQHLAHYKVPRSVVYGPLPKTATGKIQKMLLRDRARELALLI